MSLVEDARKLRSWALDEGFDRVGVASLEPSIRGEALTAWIGRGDHAEMGYLERRREVRLDPASVLPGARSVLCVATCYYPLSAAGHEVSGDLWPRVARYARGSDYHDFMVAGLRRLADRITEAYADVATRWYVDTGPILERELAARAGLGSVGKLNERKDQGVFQGAIIRFTRRRQQGRFAPQRRPP